MLSSKQRFLRQKQTAESFARMAASLEFEVASDAALLQLQEKLSLANSIEESSAKNYRLEGAKLFLATLKNIAKPDGVVEQEQIGQLKRV